MLRLFPVEVVLQFSGSNAGRPQMIARFAIGPPAAPPAEEEEEESCLARWARLIGRGQDWPIITHGAIYKVVN